MREHRIQQIEQYVREVMACFVTLDLKLAHDFKHVDRVRGWALKIAHDEGFDQAELVEAAALLHDIGLAYAEDRNQHAQVGATLAAQFLHEQKLFAAREIDSITDAIRNHSSLTGGGALGIILPDADMLDLFGSIGIMRVYFQIREARV